jgi:Zn-dependent peptidase ImmA (M78 family)
MKTRQFKSEFDSNLEVVIIGKDDFRYNIMKPMFEEYGFGFIIPTFNLIVINGELRLGKDVHKFIEAHEVAHYILGHTEEHNAEDEILADRLAHKMLDGKGYKKSAQLVIDKFEERHGIKFH